MPLHVNSVTFDAGDARTLASFWGTVFGVQAQAPNDFVAFVNPEGGPNLMFIAVPEGKSAKNRVHLDLHAEDPADVDAEAERLLAAGATFVGEHREFGVYWRTLQDPEGNELCIGTPDPEAAAEPPA
jgi:predicted enzyme related to lactoylglutathione lyase